MNALQVKVGNLEYASRLKFGTTMTYITDHPKSAVEAPGYFLQAQHMLNRGDEIRVTAFHDDGTWEKATFEVQISDKGQVEHERITEWRHGGKRVLQGLEAAHIGFGQWVVRETATKKVIAKNLAKEQAQAMAAGQQSIPVEPVPRAATGT